MQLAAAFSFGGNMIHRFSYRDVSVVMDLGSSAIHVVDPLVYELLENNYDYKSYDKRLEERYSEVEIKEAIEEIDELVDSGLLFADDKTESLFKTHSMTRQIKAMCLHVAHDCNLRCEYCFASTGAYDDHREIMDLETGKKALRFLVENSGSRYHLEVDFFGGEPLMNWEVVKELVSYGRSLEKTNNKRFRFTLTTNGLLLDDEKTEFLNQHMDNVVLSLDGRKETNDHLRKTISGKGSYETIVPKFQDFAKKRGDRQYYIRGTFTHYHLDFSEDIIHFRDLGFKELSMEPVVSEPGLPYTLEEGDLPVIFKEYEKLADDMLERYKTEDDYRFFHYEINLEGGPCAIKKASGCGAGSDYIAVTPKGEIYPCHQFVGIKDFELGTLDQGIIRPDLQGEFSALSVFNKEACKSCWAKYYCSGGCHANAYNFNKDLKVPYELGCELERKRVEMAIYLLIKKRERDDQAA